MNILERLKELEAAARQAANSDYSHTDERMDTSESFDFAYALQDAWPKLLAVIEAATCLMREYENAFDLGDIGFMDLEDALKSLEDSRELNK